MDPTEGSERPSTMYSYVDLGDAAPTSTALWAVRVQTGKDDPQPRVLAYAVSELSAKRLVLALGAPTASTPATPPKRGGRSTTGSPANPRTSIAD